MTALGILMIIIMFGALFVFIGLDNGWSVAAGIYVGVAFLFGWVMLAVYLIEGGLK